MRVGLAVVASCGLRQVGDALDVRDQVDQRGDGAGRIAVVLGAVVHGRGLDLDGVGASLKDGDLVGGEVVFTVRRHLCPLRDDDVSLQRRTH